MRAMILAAGRGERMKELTLHTPKPLLKVNGRYLIEYSIEQLRQAGIHDIVINVSYLADQIIQTIGDGSRYGVRIQYSVEAERLETGGGIFKALPLLGTDPFIVLSSDIISDYALNHLPKEPDGLAHLIVVENPPYHPQGDFGLENGRLNLHSEKTYTFANIGIYRPELFSNCQPGHFRLGSLLLPAAKEGKITGEYFSGLWYNVGSPQDLISFNVA